MVRAVACYVRMRDFRLDEYGARSVKAVLKGTCWCCYRIKSLLGDVSQDQGTFFVCVSGERPDRSMRKFGSPADLGGVAKKISASA